jgi:hypothetical protein
LLRRKEVVRILNCSYTHLERIIESSALRYDYMRGKTALLKKETIWKYLESIEVKNDWR